LLLKAMKIDPLRIWLYGWVLALAMFTASWLVIPALGNTQWGEDLAMAAARDSQHEPRIVGFMYWPLILFMALGASLFVAVSSPIAAAILWLMRRRGRWADARIADDTGGDG
jgi:hypothetical protein